MNKHEISNITEDFLKKRWRKDLLMFFFRPITFSFSNAGWKEYYNRITDEIKSDKELSNGQKTQLFKYLHKKDTIIFFRFPIYYMILVILLFGGIFIINGPSSPVFNADFLAEFIITSIVVMLARIFWYNG